jgi:deoxyhypusine synthase
MVRKEDYLSRRLQAIDVQPRTVAGLLDAMAETGFQGKALATAFQVIDRMLDEPDNTIFLGYAGSLSTTGQWKIVKWLIENRYIDVLVSTGANVSEDLVETLGHSYYQGTQVVDDSDLLRNKIDRYYDVYADELQYQDMERFIAEFMSTLESSRIYSSAEFLHQFGKYQHAQDLVSLTASAYRAQVPIFSPGLADSAYGIAAFLQRLKKGPHIMVSQFRDFEQLGDIGARSRNTSVIYIGGGVPKDTIQLVSIMAQLAHDEIEPRPHKYAVQITTDAPQWGGLSGCTLEEAVSWGKIDPSGRQAVCYCDATIALPILSHALAEKRSGKRNGADLSWVFGPAGQ